MVALVENSKIGGMTEIWSNSEIRTLVQCSVQGGGAQSNACSPTFKIVPGPFSYDLSVYKSVENPGPSLKMSVLSNFPPFVIQSE